MAMDVLFTLYCIYVGIKLPSFAVAQTKLKCIQNNAAGRIKNSAVCKFDQIIY